MASFPMFGTAQESPYDLRFSLAGIPVRVSYWFWIAGVFFGYDSLKLGPQYLIGWLVVFFVSILVHEMGHALTARLFGHRPSILLYQFGGLAFYQPFRKHTRLKSILITLAGPGAGFVLFGLALAFQHYGLASMAGLPPHVYHVLYYMLLQALFVNLYWGLINLLPILPLDGGRITQEICSFFSPFKGVIYAAWIGAIVSGLVAAYFFSRNETYNALLFAMLCMTNFTAIREMNPSYRQ